MEKVNEVDEVRRSLQDAMNFMGALAAGIELALGGPANAMAFVAGKKLGKKFGANAPKTSDIEKAVVETGRALRESYFMWHIEPFQRSNQPQLVTKNAEGDESICLVFRDCMIRQSLFKYGHPQKGSPCHMTHGFFAGALEAMTGRKAELEILHPGKNACLKRLTLRAK